MPRNPVDSAKAEREKLRERMRGYGCTMVQVAVELGRRFGLRPRVAWRYALGWAQWKVALEYNTRHPGAKLSHRRVSAHENWPHGGSPPSLHYLANLAATFRHGCTPDQLVDADDLAQLTPAERRFLTLPSTGQHVELLAPAAALISPSGATAAHPAKPERAVERWNSDTGLVWRSRRIVRCDARGVPVREEIIMAAEESAQFWRWSATTNVDDDVLEQMTADVAEIARRYQVDPPASLFSALLVARDDVFALIAGRQQPRHTTSLYQIAGQICGLLALATFDLGHPHAANTHARTALHCAEMSGYTQLRVFIRWVQSGVAYWAGRYDEAAQLMEAALPDATGGTTLLRLASQQARINAARNRPEELTRALALAATAPTDPTSDEPGILGFDAGTAAYYASEAHCSLGGAEHLEAAVDWAATALEEFTAEPQPRTLYLAAARFDLALAYLGRGDLEAVGEHLAPILRATDAEYRTVPIIGRARSLHTLLGQCPELASGTLTALRDELAEFATHPAPTPPGLKPCTPT